MKANIFLGNIVWNRNSVIITVFGFMFFLLTSCQKRDDILNTYDSPLDLDMIAIQNRTIDCSDRYMSIYYGHEIFRRTYGAPVTEEKKIKNPSFSCFGDLFILKIRSGKDKRTRLASGEIWIDRKLIVRQSDFNKNTSMIVKYIAGLTPESILEVRLQGTPGSFIDLWIEGTMNSIIPLFDQIGPLCQNSDPPILPLSSANEPPITGIWDPEVINTSVTGKTTYTFTPDEGQCAAVVKMEIEVITAVEPQFEIPDTLLQGVEAPLLPGISTNGIAGTWSPETIDTSTPGKYTYTFTPDQGQCASVYSINIEIISNNVITDNEGNVYKIVKIGDQWWMSENLRTSHYNNREMIGTTTPVSLDISGMTDPRYQWAFNGDENMAAVYGRYYTWYAATDSRGVCPVGWHIPNDAEWTQLVNYMSNNGFGYEGSGTDIAKSIASTSGWIEDVTPGNVGNNQALNNSSGFNGIPAGVRNYLGSFRKEGQYASWWSSTESSPAKVFYRNIYYNISFMNREESDKNHGATIRCLKDK